MLQKFFQLLKLSNDICVDLYHKNLLVQSLLVICNSFDEFVINIEYPAKSYEEISKIISDLIEQNNNPSRQIQISVVDKQNDTFEKKFEVIQQTAKPIESIEMTPLKMIISHLNRINFVFILMLLNPYNYENSKIIRHFKKIIRHF